MTVFVYVNTAEQVGNVDHIKVFSSVGAAESGLRKTTLRWSPSSTTF